MLPLVRRHSFGVTLSVLATAVASPAPSQPVPAEQMRITQLLRAGVVEADAMQFTAPSRYMQLTARFAEAIRRDPEWFMAYIRDLPDGAPLPYHPRLGLSETEHREFLALADSARLRPVGAAPLRVEAVAHGWRFDGGSALPDLTGVEIDTVAGVVRTPLGEARGPEAHPATAEQKVTGPVDRLVWEHEAFSDDLRDGASIRFSLGRHRESGRTLLRYEARRVAGGKQTGRVNRSLLMDAPSPEPPASGEPPSLDGRLLTPAVDTMYAIALRTDGSDTVGVSVQRLTRSTGPGGEVWLQVYSWTGKDGSTATDSLIMDYRTLRPVSQARHTTDGSSRLTYSGSRVHGVVTPSSGTTSPFDTTFDRPVYSSGASDLLARALPPPAGRATEVYLFDPPPGPAELQRARMWVERSDVVRARDGRRVDCWVVVGAMPGSDVRIWIDKQSRQLVQMVADEDGTRYLYRR